jgi:hypothetical protein
LETPLLRLPQVDRKKRGLCAHRLCVAIAEIVRLEHCHVAGQSGAANKPRAEQPYRKMLVAWHGAWLPFVQITTSAVIGRQLARELIRRTANASRAHPLGADARQIAESTSAPNGNRSYMARLAQTSLPPETAAENAASRLRISNRAGFGV